MPPLNPNDIGTVAGLLACDLRDLTPTDTATWARCDEARYRTSISRAYYAAFLAFKGQLVRRRVDWSRDPRSFPQAGVHGHLLVALAQVLSHGHVLVVNVKQLKRDRERADYELIPPSLNKADADTAMDVWIETKDEIEHLTADEWQDIANTLFDVVSEARR